MQNTPTPIRCCLTFLASALLLALASSQASADIRVTGITTSDAETRHENHFPFIETTDPARQRVADSINLLLQISELRANSPQADTAGPYPLDTRHELQNQTENLQQRNYRVIHQTPRFLTLQTDIGPRTNTAQLQPGFSQRYIRNYVFDLDSGQPVTLNLLLSREGIIWLNEQLMAQRNAVYEQLLARIPAAPGHRTEHETNTEADPSQNEYTRYEDCQLWSVEEAGGTVMLTSNAQALQLLPHTLVMEDLDTSCLGGQTTLHGVNVKPGWHNEISYASLAPYLSAYGQCLLNGSGPCQPHYPLRPEPGLWSGTLPDGNHITLVVTSYDPHYMDGMGDDLNGYIIWNRKHLYPVRVHNERRDSSWRDRDHEPESEPDTDTVPQPIFSGPFRFTTSDQVEHFLQLAFTTDGLWEYVSTTSDTQHTLSPGLP